MMRTLAILILIASPVLADDTKKHTVTANDVAWTASCEGKSSSSTGTGTVTYADKTFSGSSEATVKIKGGTDIKISMKITGKYLGACPKT